LAVVSAVKIPDPHSGSESIHDWVVGTLIDPSRLHHSVPRSGAFRRDGRTSFFELTRIAKTQLRVGPGV